MRKERWRSLPQFPSYEISDRGRIKQLITSKRHKAGHISNGGPDHYGYRIASLTLDGTRAFKIHRLVVMAFISDIPAGMQVNHLNGIKDDNRVENLEIATHSRNQKHSFEFLGRKFPAHESRRGEEHPRAKLTDEVVRTLRKLYEQGTSQKTLAKKYGVHTNTVRNAIRGVFWSHVS